MRGHEMLVRHKGALAAGGQRPPLSFWSDGDVLPFPSAAKGFFGQLAVDAQHQNRGVRSSCSSPPNSLRAPAAHGWAKPKAKCVRLCVWPPIGAPHPPPPSSWKLMLQLWNLLAYLPPPTRLAPRSPPRAVAG